MPDRMLLGLLLALVAIVVMVLPGAAVVLLWGRLPARRHHDHLIPATPRTLRR